MKVFEREFTWKYYLFSGFGRRMTQNVLAKTESVGTDLTGSWNNTIFTASDVNAYQDANNILAFSDSKGTKGNFVHDVDGNVLLDLCGTESLPLGHNHDALIKVSVI